VPDGLGRRRVRACVRSPSQPQDDASYETSRTLSTEKSPESLTGRSCHIGSRGGGFNDGSMEDCVTIAPLAGGGHAPGDNKPEGEGRELRTVRAELLAFAQQIPGIVG
jgi:hypothetical protein